MKADLFKKDKLLKNQWGTKICGHNNLKKFRKDGESKVCLAKNEA